MRLWFVFLISNGVTQTQDGVHSICVFAPQFSFGIESFNTLTSHFTTLATPTFNLIKKSNNAILHPLQFFNPFITFNLTRAFTVRAGLGVKPNLLRRRALAASKLDCQQITLGRIQKFMPPEMTKRHQ